LDTWLSTNLEGPTVKKHLAAVTTAAFLILAPAAPALAQTAEPLAPASHVVTQQPNPNPPAQDQDNGSSGKWGLLGLLGLLGLPGLLGRRREQRDTAYRERVSPR
jgi:MYXO-CTERM domain-containing protein